MTKLVASRFEIIINPPQEKLWFTGGRECLLRCVAGGSVHGKSNITYRWYRYDQDGNMRSEGIGMEVRIKPARQQEEDWEGIYQCEAHCAQRHFTLKSQCCKIKALFPVSPASKMSSQYSVMMCWNDKNVTINIDECLKSL